MFHHMGRQNGGKAAIAAEGLQGAFGQLGRQALTKKLRLCLREPSGRGVQQGQIGAASGLNPRPRKGAIAGADIEHRASGHRAGGQKIGVGVRTSKPDQLLPPAWRGQIIF